MKSSYKFVIGLLVLIIIVAGAVFAGKSNAKQLTIGAILPLTGSVASYGTFMKQGMELALADAIEQKIVGEGEVRIAFEDTAGDPAKGVSAFQKLVAVDSPVAVVSALSGVTLAAKPLANEKHIPLLNGSAVSTDIEDADDYMFSVLPNADIEGAFLAEAAYGQGKRNIAILYRSDASGKSFSAAFKEKFESLGGKIAIEDTHTPNATDFRANISRLAAAKNIDGVFVASYGPEVAQYLKQSYEVGFRKQIYAYTTFYSPKVLEIAGDAANGVFFSSPAFDAGSDDPKAVELRKKIESRYAQKESNYYVASHYDAMRLLIQAIKAGNATGEGIRNYLANLGEYEGISGKIVFDKNGMGSIPLKMYTVKEGRFVKAD